MSIGICRKKRIVIFTLVLIALALFSAAALGGGTLTLNQKSYIWLNSSENNVSQDSRAPLTGVAWANYFMGMRVAETGGVNTNPDGFWLRACQCTSTSDCSNCNAASATNWQNLGDLLWEFWDSSNADGDTIASPTWTGNAQNTYEENNATAATNLNAQSWEQRWVIRSPNPASATRYMFKLTNQANLLTTYTNVSDITIQPGETAPPNVTLISPADTANSTLNPTFIFNVTDDFAVNNCSLVLDGAVDQTDTSITKIINQSFTKALSSEGTYRWTVQCADYYGNVGNATPAFTFNARKENTTLAARTYFADAINRTAFEANWTQLSNSQKVTKIGLDDVIIPKANSALVFAVDSSGNQIWNYSYAATTSARVPIVGDFNRDGFVNDIAYLHDDTTDIAVALNRSGIQLWNTSLDVSLSWPKTSVGDINRNGYFDDFVVAAGDGAKLYAFNGSGATLWTYTHPAGYDIIEAAVGDFNKSGYKDSVVFLANEDAAGNNDALLFMMDQNGNHIWNATLNTTSTHHRAFGSITMRLADLNNDGYEDIIVSDSNDVIYGYNNSGSRLWSANTPGIGSSTNWPTAIEVGDFDNDKLVDDVAYAPYVDQTPYPTVFINNSGEQIRNVSVGSINEPTVLIAFDYDNDGFFNELLFRGNANPFSSIFNETGEVVTSITKVTTEYSAGTGDLDNDGFEDDVVMSINSEIIAYSSTGAVLWNFTKDSGNAMTTSEMPVGDFDADFSGCMIKFTDRKTWNFMRFDAVNNSIYKYERYYPNEGEYNYTINCTSFNNIYSESSSSGSVYVDRTKPQLFPVGDNPDPVNAGSAVLLNATVTDNLQVNTVWAEVIKPSGAAGNFTMGTSGNGNLYNYSYTDTSATGTYNWKVYANDSGANINVSVANTFTVQSTVGNLKPILITPKGENSQPQNITFTITANVSCKDGAGVSCGQVNGTLRYNLTANPDAKVTGSGVYAAPFYTIQANSQSCGELTVTSANCSLTWTVNTTGNAGDSYKLDVNFTTNVTATAANNTNYTTLSIIEPTFSITLSNPLSDILFPSFLDPGTTNTPATNNSISTYNVTCSADIGLCNISIKGNSDLQSGSNFLGITNISWSHLNNSGTETSLTTSYATINATLANGAIQKLFFWIDIPSAQANGNYVGNLTILAQKN